MTLTANDLDHFTGSGRFTRHGLMRTILMSDGALHVAEAGGAHWLMDKIATNQLQAHIKGEEFQTWTLTVTDGRGRLVATDGDDHTIHEEVIDWTDFPLPEITLWFANDVIYLPSEH